MKNSDLQEEAITAVSNSLFKRVEESPLTLPQIAEKAKMSRGYLNQLKSGERRLNIFYMYKIALALDLYPSEILPIEWQKKTGETPSIDTKILQRAITKVFELQHAIIRKLSEGEISALISIVYDKMQKGESFQDADILKFTKDTK